jgi:DNA-binding NarL/FixJ family response regulator
MSGDLNNDSIRVLVVDDHELFRIGLRQLLESEGFGVADAGSAEAARRRLPSLSPDVVVMGVNVLGALELEATRRIRDTAPAAAVLMLPIVADDEHVLQAIQAGAVGYLLKDSELGRSSRASEPSPPDAPPSGAGGGVRDSQRARRGRRALGLSAYAGLRL